MADVASVGNEPNIKPEDVTELERLIDSYTESLQPLIISSFQAKQRVKVS